MLSGPIRSVWHRAAGDAVWQRQGRAVISLAMILAVFGAFTQYVHPVVNAWSAAPPAGVVVPAGQVFALAADGSGQRRITIDDRDVRGPALFAGWVDPPRGGRDGGRLDADRVDEP